MNRAVDNLLSAISVGDGPSFHLIDVENLVGSGVVTTEAVSELCRTYVQDVYASREDLFLVAAGPQNAEAVREGWKAGQTFYQFRKGKDGADLALVDFFQSIENINSFKSVFVASGDHSLEPVAESCKTKSVPVTVVTGVGKLSRVLERYPHMSVGGLK